MKDWKCIEVEAKASHLEKVLDTLAREGYDIFQMDIIKAVRGNEKTVGKEIDLYIVSAYKDMDLEEAARRYAEDRKEVKEQKESTAWFEE